ncbi:MAG TPA: hypothetical protein VH186_34600 [Chloroflexia bacterium]|nr:hypothetical protein [Chloroflexia bacterium]
MAKQPEDPQKKSWSFQSVLRKYGQYLFMPTESGVPVEEQDYNQRVITIWERLERKSVVQEEHKRRVGEVHSGDGWLVRRIEPKEPIDFMEYYRRKN